MSSQIFDGSIASTSQSTQITDSVTKDKDSLINERVSFLVSFNSTLLPLKRTDILQGFGKVSIKENNMILKTIKKKLHHVYGIKLKSIGPGRFILVNPNNCKLSEENPSPSQSFLILILSILAMNKYSLSLESLERCFQNLDIFIGSEHPYYGDTGKLVKEFEKQLYLKKITTAPSEVFYEWGERSKLEVDKKRLVHFICDITGKNGTKLLNDKMFCEIMAINIENERSSSESSEEETAHD